MNGMEEIRKGYEAQKRYCEEKHLPMFVRQDCRCHRCGGYVFGGEHGYSPEAAGRTLITGCPHCNASFCD